MLNTIVKILVVLLLCLTVARQEEVKLAFTFPGNVYKIQTVARSTIQGAVFLENPETNVSVCLIKNGTQLLSTDCLESYNSTENATEVYFRYEPTQQQIYFLRVDVAGGHPKKLAKFHVRYQVTTYPASTSAVEPAAGPLALGSSTVVSAAMGVRLGSVYASSSQYYDGMLYKKTVSAYDSSNLIQNGMNLVLTVYSPSDIVSQFAMVDKQTRCMIDITTEIGLWFIFFELEMFVYDLFSFSIGVATNPNCFELILCLVLGLSLSVMLGL